MSVTLTLNGQQFHQFESLKLTRSLSQVAGQLQLTYSGYDTITPGAAFTLKLDDQLALTGFIDAVDMRLSSTGTQRQCYGRDRTADLVDCSVPDTAQLNALKLDALITQLTQAYKVPVRVDPATDVGEVFETWATEPGESLWASIEKACRARAVLAVGTQWGELLLTRAGNVRHPAELVEGVNVVAARYRHDLTGRFQRYECLAQLAGGSAGQWDPTGTTSDADQAQAAAVANDNGARKPRRLVMVQDSSANSADLATRVQWECNVRRGKSQTLSITVVGFGEKGLLWRPNQLVAVNLPSFNVGGTWLIESVSNSLSNSGSTTELELVPPSAYSLIREPLPVKASSSTEPWSPDK